MTTRRRGALLTRAIYRATLEELAESNLEARDPDHGGAGVDGGVRNREGHRVGATRADDEAHITGGEHAGGEVGDHAVSGRFAGPAVDGERDGRRLGGGVRGAGARDQQARRAGDGVGSGVERDRVDRGERGLQHPTRPSASHRRKPSVPAGASGAAVASAARSRTSSMRRC